MEPQTVTNLPDHLDLIAGAPEGIQKLRGLILELAVRGKLVPQDPNDEPASELLKRIAKERARLEAEGKIKKSKPLPAVGENEKSFEVSQGWVWLRLADSFAVITDGDHLPPPKSATGVPFLVIGNLNTGQINFEGCRCVPESYFNALDWSKQPNYGDLLYTVTGSYGITVPVRTDAPFCVQRHVAILKSLPSSPADYILKYLQSLTARSFAHSVATGIAQKTVTLGALREMPVAVPPLAEQHRIVAKVDELMALCDRLEAEAGAGEKAHAKLVETLLGTLTQSADAAELAANWQRLAEHFDTLFTTEASIDALKQTILHLAVMGKLVPRDPNDEPVGELLKWIAKERARLEADGVCRKSKPLPNIGKDEQLFDAPETWTWRRLDDLFLISGGITLGRNLLGRKLVSKPYLRVANVQRGYLVLDHIKTIEIPADEINKYTLQYNDLLITEGGDWDKVGRAAIWQDEIEDCLHQNHIFRARPISKDWNCRWAELYLNSAPARSYFAGASKQTTNLASINMTQLKACAFPVPPLAEQHRIVAKVDELMALCDRLKADLADARVRQARLSAVLIESALQAS
jgi:type I restriction enzyme, S subunit